MVAKSFPLKLEGLLKPLAQARQAVSANMPLIKNLPSQLAPTVTKQDAMPKKHARALFGHGVSEKGKKSAFTVAQKISADSSFAVTTDSSLSLQQAKTRLSTGFFPEGLRARNAMVQRLQQQGISDALILHAMQTVPRHSFVDEGLRGQAYTDSALPIGYEQTISQPYIVARMLQAASNGRGKNNRLHKVLEIGTGCGYQAAVLAHVAREVFSIERIRGLHDNARENLRALRLPNLRLVYGDGLLGLPDNAPFDAIIIAAAGLSLPHSLLMQLALGGRLLAPIVQDNGQQILTLIDRKSDGSFHSTSLEPARFVPLLDGKR